MLGVTLPHEHVIHSICVQSGNPDNRFDDVELMAAELGRFKAAGGDTVWEMTTVGIGRNPAALREVSSASGVRIISGFGLYQESVLPTGVIDMNVEELTRFLANGIEDTDLGIRAGVIGEIASHNDEHADFRAYTLNEFEKRLFCAAAGAQKRTGLCISTHASIGRGGVAQVRVLADAGADLSRVVVGHCDAHYHEDLNADMDYYHTLLNEGVAVEFDLFGWEELMPDEQRYRRLAHLVDEGYAGQLLISTDTCRLSHLSRSGGRGYDHLFTSIIPELRDRGVEDKQINEITVLNPRRLLSG